MTTQRIGFRNAASSRAWARSSLMPGIRTYSIMKNWQLRRGVGEQRVAQLGHGGTFGDRHQAAANLVVGGVERDREVDASPAQFGQFANPVDSADRGKWQFARPRTRARSGRAARGWPARPLRSCRNGSPMPMKTTLRIERWKSRWAAATCPTISLTVRLRRSPSWAVSQKAQPRAQPTCEETQRVCQRWPRRDMGTTTDSISSPSGARCTNLVRSPSMSVCTTGRMSARQPFPDGSPCTSRR